MIDNVWTSASQRLTWYVVALLAPLAVIACNSGDSQPRSTPKGPAPVRIEVTGVQHISVQRQVELAGTLISPDQAKVSSEVAGRVKELVIELGQEVETGQPLVKLDPRELDLALRQAEGQLHQTEA